MTWQATSAAVWRSSWGSACLACLVRVDSPRHYLASPWKTRQPSNINAAWLALVRLFGTVCQIVTADAAPCRSIVLA
jgi:hypothetical protein